MQPPRVLALVVALAAAEVKIETKPKPCKKFKCYGRKDPAPRSPYFAPRGRGACPEGASEHLAKCCAERDACATICGITEELCKKAFDECYVRVCEEVDDFDEHEQCLKDGKIGSDWPWRGGCSWHSEEQKKACMCQGRKEAEERRRSTLKHIYKRYGGDASKVDELLIKADTPSKFAQLLLRLSAKRFPTLLSDRRPPPEPKKASKPPPPPQEEEEVVEEEAVEDAVEEEAGEEDVIDLDAGEL